MVVKISATAVHENIVYAINLIEPHRFYSPFPQHCQSYTVQFVYAYMYLNLYISPS